MDASRHKSEAGQDAFFDEVVFEGAARGVYLDVGCNDGVTGSNSWLFAQRTGWFGVCVEADPSKFAQVAAASGRTDQVNVALSTNEGRAEFIRTGDAGGGLSGLAATLDVARAREYELTAIQVATTTPAALLRRYYAARRTLDLVSIYIEGAEASVVRLWPFEGWCVSAFTIENNNWCNASGGILPELLRLLAPHCYAHVREIGADEVFVRQPPCPETSAPLPPLSVIRERAVVRVL